MEARKIERKSKENRKAEVLAAIANIISEEGIAAVSTKRVADFLGISQPGIYRYFASRDEMLIAFIEHMSGLLSEILTTIRSAPNTRARMEQFYSIQLDLIERTELLPKILFFEEFHQSGTQLQVALKALVDRYENGIRKMLIEGIEGGEMVRIDGDSAMKFIKGAVLTCYLDWILDRKSYSLVGVVPKLMEYLDKTLFSQNIPTTGPT